MQRADGFVSKVLAALDFSKPETENISMTIPGRVQNGVVVLEGNSALPEGAVVVVSYTAPLKKPEHTSRIEVPLVRTGEPGTVHLTNQQIAEILDDEDAAS